MAAPVEPTHVELGQLRELLTEDRLSAGEARKAQGFQPLATATYHMPWRVAARRRWRSDRQLRVRSFCASLAVVAALALWQAPQWSAPGALTGEPNVRPAALAATKSVRSKQSPSLPDLADGPTAAVQQELEPRGRQELPTSTLNLSPRRRLQRADLWLRVGTERGAREARGLLESALRDLPNDPHGHAALAEACLRLHDKTCARAAIDKAMQVRPWRAGYRRISREIDATFVATP